ncbi:unnamed protein product [Rhizoctonia solani]|uniref:F-box domain-containing protein n=1 Tax=Rhizoctonia solani TaxID=456999 RepID=A0A8H3C0W9_9AGAM|nr:unnamed protein product [Rhizoctonia solani]
MQCEDQPWYPEDTLFEEEWLRTRGEFTGYERIAVSFAFMSEGEIVPIGPQAGGKEYQGLELLAAVGNSKGRRGMFAQAVWFGDGGAPWKWMRIDGIEKVILYDGLAHPFRSGLVSVITEVLCNVTPFELLSLSHTCKFLQEMIMRRTAEYIWLTAERNSATYPSYPWADISKPHFAGLLFMMLCTVSMRESYCQSAGSISSRPSVFKVLFNRASRPRIRFAETDLYLTRLMTFPRSSMPLWELLPHTSLKCDPLVAPHSRYALRRQYDAVSNTITLISKSVSLSSYHRWMNETKEEVRLGQEFGQILHAHFERLESVYQKSLEGVRNQRAKEIKRRLRELGWLEEDFDFAPSQAKEWAVLVNITVPLTDQEWSKLYFKLGPLLFSNRTRVQKAQREKNLVRQNILLTEFLASLKDDLLWHPLLPFFRALEITHRPKAVTEFLDSYPFPSNELAKTWPFFVNVGNMETGEAELRARFGGDRERIKAHIANWRADIEITLANRLMEERGVFTMAEAEPWCRVEVNRSNQATQALPLYTQLLLRADSVFTDGSSKCAPLYYPEFIPTKPRFVSGHTRTIICVDRFHRALEPEQVARALLGELGLEDASYLELATFGERFICFRCSPRSRKLMNWKGILGHYLDEQRLWNFAMRLNGPRFKTITPTPIKCAHSLASTGNLPLVDLLTPGCVKLWKSSMSHSMFGEDKYFCFLCKNYGCAYFASEVKTLKRHMREVHDCRSKIVEDVHYGLIKESGTFLETGAAWRTRWNEFDHAEGAWSEDESE